MPGTIISSASVNADFSDIATALTQSLATTGVSSMSGPIKGIDGAVGAPGYTFSGETSTGMYRSGSGIISFAGAGTNLLTISSSALTFNNQSITTTGTITAGALIASASGLSVTGTATITGNLQVTGTVTGTGGYIGAVERFPNTTSYTVVSADHLRLISSQNAGGTLNLNVPNTVLSGTQFSVMRLTNNVVVTVTGGNVLFPSGISVSSFTMAQNVQVNTFFYDGANLLIVGNVTPFPTVQTFTSGSGATYTPSAGTLKIRVRMCGGGGGGSATNTNNGSNGGSTSFGSWSAGAGSGGTVASNGGLGGSGGSNGTGTLVYRVTGGAGGGAASGTGGGMSGAAGGTNPFQGAGTSGGSGSNGQSAAGNTGGGGQGGGSGGQTQNGSGGGAGEYVEFWVNAPGATVYTIGGGGGGGAAGVLSGGNGAAGVLIIEEFYW